MHDYEERAKLLLKEGIVHEDSIEQVNAILINLKNNYDIDEKDTSFFIHILMCLERAYHGTQLCEGSMNDQDELQKMDGYSASLIELRKIEIIANVKLSECEKHYILIHLLRFYEHRK